MQPGNAHRSVIETRRTACKAAQMRHTTTVALTILALGLNLGVVSCAMPSRSSYSADARDSRTSRPSVRSTAGTSEIELEALRLEEIGDNRALVDLLEESLDNHVPGARRPVARAYLELMLAEALVGLDRKLTALTAFGRAWAEVSPNVNGVGGVILQEWAHHEMIMGNYRSAVEHYARALQAHDLSRDRERDLRCCLVVAYEAGGQSAKAADQMAMLDRKGISQIGATRARLLSGQLKRKRSASPGVVDAFLPHGVIPMNPSLILSGIRPRDEWGARGIGPDHVPMTPINSITVHHTAMPPPSRYSTIAQLKQIQDIHTQDNGWADMGYHFIVDPNGQVWEGRRLMYQGAHAGGAANIGNVGVCLMGDFDSSRVPAAQMNGLSDLVLALRTQFGVAKSEVRTHREWKATACPGQHLHSAVVGYRSGSRSTLALQ